MEICRTVEITHSQANIIQNGVSSDLNVDKIHIKEVDTLKSLIIKPPILKFYNPNLPIKISCEASQKGLDAVLEQQHENIWHPIGYASRTLTPTEQNYCQLEKGILSIVFGCQ